LTLQYKNAIFLSMRQRKPSPGFSQEGRASFKAAATPATATVELGAGGRLVIPAPMRAALGIEIGDRLTVRLEDNQLKIVTYQEALRQARQVLKKYVPPGVDVVDDFLRWKREQTALEKAKLGDRKRSE
jgi:AbrB family looped-hinge helix DNA binding protein